MFCVAGGILPFRLIIRFSKPLYQNLKAIKAFLFERMYRAPSVIIERRRVTAMVQALFPLFLDHPDLLPEDWQGDVAQALAAGAPRTELARVVLDEDASGGPA